MILVALGLVGFGLSDLIRWSPDRATTPRAVASVAAGALGIALVAALSGACFSYVLLAAAISAAVLAVWVGFDYLPLEQGSALPLGWVMAVMAALFATSGSVSPISGPLERWYADLGFAFVGVVSVDQSLLALAAVIFMTASGNRIVRLVLDAAGVSRRSESALKGGRLLGPLERLIVFAIVLAGDPATAAIVVTGKGLLRFPEIRSEALQPGPDAVTEYFLIGTFVSLLIASLLAILVLAAG
ncbi:MAG TPA: hypothetical protein VKA35_05690 [Solirubrobacterales bacterium]|nr:hypothetical protein [Solirubrobacterales bacterium]